MAVMSKFNRAVYPLKVSLYVRCLHIIKFPNVFVPREFVESETGKHRIPTSRRDPTE